MKISPWIEAMRLRTLPVSVAGVVAGTSCAIMYGRFGWPQALLCLIFAVLAQIASNFGNEYYDYAGGLDKKGREGFRRGVTEGDITPRAMKRATFITLGLACAVGCSLIYWGGWWLVPVGFCIALFALAYSTGPWPLSHHGLGDIAVVVFFGLVPVCFTCWLQAPETLPLHLSVPMGIAIGLLAANVLVVNNYRDMEDDASVGKRTTVVIFGRKVMGRLYYASGWLAMLVLIPFWAAVNTVWLCIPCLYLLAHTLIHRRLCRCRGAALNPLLGMTAIELLIFSILVAIAAIAA